ncbi:MAG: Acetolactate synthase isozyme 3 large subunit [Syntrophaceae bacterium PtaU1.Bin231]|nr:MAG: Acetolactate synthase isozyme 3 large subunit [Syntrophaceae bacterium PtaU1.Bin231]
MKLTGSEVLFRTLHKEDANTIFGYPGGSVMDIYDEMFRQKDIRHILVRHEQGAIHAADGYARASGKVGVCLVTSGPGATNTVTGIANAYGDSIPVVVFTGQVPTHLIGNDAFQEVDITGITRSCTKHNYLVRRIEDLARTVREAFHIARSGRPGPVLIDLPKDVMQSSIDEGAIEDEVHLNGTSALPDIEEDCVRAFKLLKEARRPLLFVGGGVILGKACDDLRTFARRLHVPVISSLMGLGAFPGTDPLSLGMVGMHGTYYANMAISHCDLLFAVGVRFDDRVTSKLEAFAPHAKIVHIDIDAVSLERTVRTDIPILSDSKRALSIFNRLMAEASFSYPPDQTREWLEQVAAWKKRVPLSYCRSQRIKPQYVVEKLFEITGGDAIVTTEVGQNQMWAAQFYKFDHPNSFITSGGLGAMGFGFPAAIGAQVACPDRTVVDIAGDGSIQMNIQELATAVTHRIPVKVVILNNLYLGMVRQWQELYYGKRYSQSHINTGPDFVKLAEAYGAVGLRTDKPEEVKKVLTKGLNTEGPVFMDIRVEPEEGVYPIVKPGAPLTEMDLGKPAVL